MGPLLTLTKWLFIDICRDVKATKQQIRFMKREDVSSTRNALRIAERAEETGRDTLARLGVQGEHVHNAERSLGTNQIPRLWKEFLLIGFPDLAHNQNRLAEERAREIKTLNRSGYH